MTMKVRPRDPIWRRIRNVAPWADLLRSGEGTSSPWADVNADGIIPDITSCGHTSIETLPLVYSRFVIIKSERTCTEGDSVISHTVLVHTIPNPIGPLASVNLIKAK